MVNSLEAAMKWFLSHSDGTVTCKKGDETRECESYGEAEEFYNS